MSKSHQIGLIIKSCRESRRISQDYMADMLDIGQSTYAYLESGKTSMSIDRLLRITEILELNIHEVIDESLLSQAPKESAHDKYAAKEFSTDTKEAYNELITELRNEVEFLKRIVNRTL